MKNKGKSVKTIENALRIYILIREAQKGYTKREISDMFEIHIDTVDYLFRKMRGIGIKLIQGGYPEYRYSILSKNAAKPPYRPLMTYQEAKDWVAENLIPIGINTYSKFLNYKSGKIPNAPNAPEALPWPNNYKEFEGWAKFFGRTVSRANGLIRLTWPDYSDAKKIVQAAGLKIGSEYKSFRKACKTPLPAAPNVAYREEWEGWKKFLRKG